MPTNRVGREKISYWTRKTTLLDTLDDAPRMGGPDPDCALQLTPPDAVSKLVAGQVFDLSRKLNLF